MTWPRFFLKHFLNMFLQVTGRGEHPHRILEFDQWIKKPSTWWFQHNWNTLVKLDHIPAPSSGKIKTSSKPPPRKNTTGFPQHHIFPAMKKPVEICRCFQPNTSSPFVSGWWLVFHRFPSNTLTQLFALKHLWNQFSENWNKPHQLWGFPTYLPPTKFQPTQQKKLGNNTKHLWVFRVGSLGVQNPWNSKASYPETTGRDDDSTRLAAFFTPHISNESRRLSRYNHDDTTSMLQIEMLQQKIRGNFCFTIYLK